MAKYNIDKQLIIKLYKEGKNCKEIAKIYGCTMTNIQTHLRRLGIKLRDNNFKKGTNSWDFLDDKQTIERKKKLSERMTKYNPLFNEDAKKRQQLRMKMRLGESGRLKFREKNIILASVGKCEKCGIPYPLTIHHKDGNRYNNKRENLEVLCFNHHEEADHPNPKYGYNAYYISQKGGLGLTNGRKISSE